MSSSVSVMSQLNCFDRAYSTVQRLMWRSMPSSMSSLKASTGRTSVRAYAVGAGLTMDTFECVVRHHEAAFDENSSAECR